MRLRIPITNSGKINYVELLKIVVLVFASIGLFSFLSNQVVLENAFVSTVISALFGLIVYTSVAIVTVVSVNNLLKTIKEFVIPFIGYKPIIVLIDKINKMRLGIISNYRNISCHRLCVVRC